MEFRINIHGCQPYHRNSHLSTKSAQKSKEVTWQISNTPRYVWLAERASGEMINSKRMPNAKLVFANGISNLSKYRRALVKKNSEFMPESKIKSIFKT